MIATNQIKISLLNKNKDNIITNNNIELDLENIFLIQKVILLNPYCTDWFAWIDGGHNSDLTATTNNNKDSISMLKWPDQVQLDKLPIDKFIHANSITTTTTTNSTTIGATFIYHLSISNTITDLYHTTLLTCINTRTISYTTCTIQYILSHMLSSKPILFHTLITDTGSAPGTGTGTLIPLLGFTPYSKIPASVLPYTSIINANNILTKYAIITMVSSNDYVILANTLYYTLLSNLNNTIYKQTTFIALIIDTHNNNYINTNLLGWNIVYVTLIKPPYEGAVTFERFKEQYTKLHIWNMISFKRILYIDSDCICLKDLSNILIYSKYSFSAVYDWEQGQIRNHFNMGVFSIQPNNTEYIRLINLQSTIRKGYRLEMAEQGLINYIYNNHNIIDIYPFTYNGNLAAAVQNIHYWEKKYIHLHILHYTWIKPYMKDAIQQCKNNIACIKTMLLWNNYASCIPSPHM